MLCSPWRTQRSEKSGRVLISFGVPPLGGTGRVNAELQTGKPRKLGHGQSVGTSH